VGNDPVLLYRPGANRLLGGDDLPKSLRLKRAPKRIPNGSDVLLLGCQREDYAESFLVAILNEPGKEIVSLPRCAILLIELVRL
jgi:hypothetical protein